MGDPVTMALMAVKVGGGIMEARNAKKSANMQAQSYERQALATQIETDKRHMVEQEEEVLVVL